MLLLFINRMANPRPDNVVPKPLFRDLNAEDLDPETSEIESLCLNCEKNVSTILKIIKR